VEHVAHLENEECMQNFYQTV